MSGWLMCSRTVTLLHHRWLIHRQTPPTLRFPVVCGSRSRQNGTPKPSVFKLESGSASDNRDSVKQISEFVHQGHAGLQLVRLIFKDWTLAKTIVGMGRRLDCVSFLSRCLTPPFFPLFLLLWSRQVWKLRLKSLLWLKLYPPLCVGRSTSKSMEKQHDWNPRRKFRSYLILFAWGLANSPKARFSAVRKYIKNNSILVAKRWILGGR